MLGCLADGQKLTPFVIYKGKPGAKNKVVKELEAAVGFAPGQHYGVQENAWMGAETMLSWIATVWEPFVMTRSGMFLLLLDEAKSHMTGEVLTKLGSLRTLVEFIPGGYTSKLQVMDVGLNKSYKVGYNSAHFKWQREWVLSKPIHVKPKPTRLDVSWWVANGWAQITPAMIFNTWRAIGFYGMLSQVDPVSNEDNSTDEETVKSRNILDSPTVIHFEDMEDELKM